MEDVLHGMFSKCIRLISLKGPSEDSLVSQREQVVYFNDLKFVVWDRIRCAFLLAMLLIEVMFTEMLQRFFDLVHLQFNPQGS